MKTLMNQLKFGTLLTAFLFLSSCTGDASIDCVKNPTSNSFYSSSMKSQTGECEKLSLSLRYSTTSNNDPATVLLKHSVKPDHFLTVLPISFGPEEATLVTN